MPGEHRNLVRNPHMIAGIEGLTQSEFSSHAERSRRYEKCSGSRRLCSSR